MHASTISNSTEDDTINELWVKFKKQLNEAISVFIPTKAIVKRFQVPWMTRTLKRMFRKKQRLYKKTHKWSNYYFFQKECKMAYKAAEDTYIHEQIHKSLSQHNTKPFWRYIKSKKQDNVGVSPLLKDGKLEVDSKPKAEILLSQFSSVFSTLKTNIMPDVSLHVEESLNHIKIDQKGTEKLLRNLNISKASGPDSIPNIVLKECAAELSPVVTHIFQKSIDSGTLPEDWTSANIAPIYKKGDRHRAENYRPVSLTSVLSKVLEYIIVHSLLEHFDKN